eukprot:Phypoly_transcript_09653.p1 GENE.Phypoly_transcript_09653~~Phypoly_transcript_09653.p1  ORF type:complete len:449 (+),score=50.72 Phypoly_transcript_09653:22-1347(+)
MDFSLFHGHGGSSLCKFSPDGTLLATAAKFRLVVRNSESLEIVHIFSCLDNIQTIEWSSDSTYILCAMLKRGTVQVWCINQPRWTCKIDEGLAGLVHARWSPDGRHILTTADFQVRITVWSLVNKSVCYIKSPKLPVQGLAFSRDGKFMAVAERRDCKDFVSVYSCATWEQIKQFKVSTADLVDLSWSPDGRVICVWDTPLEYKVFLYSPDGRQVEKYQAYEHALGIKSVEWSSSSQFLSIGSYDQKLRVLNHLTWKVLGEFSHSPAVTSTIAIYHEVDIPEPLEDNQQEKAKTKYIIEDPPVSLPFIKPPPEKPNPKMGVGMHSWSTDNKYILSKNDNIPHVLWVWHVPKLELHSIIWHKEEIKCAKWDPVHPSRLAVCSGTPKIYFWRPEGASSVDIPSGGEEEFNVVHLEWHPSGNSLVLFSKGKLCCCYLPENYQNQ